MVKDNLDGLNLFRLSGRTTDEQENIGKILDFSSFLLKKHLKHFLIYQILYYHIFEISNYKKHRNQTGGKKTFAECK